MKTPSEEILKYPTPFSIRAFGEDQEDFNQLIYSIVSRHVPDLSPSSVSTRPSKGGKYLAVTVKFMATSRAQLDALYVELSDHPRVVMVL